MDVKSTQFRQKAEPATRVLIIGAAIVLAVMLGLRLDSLFLETPTLVGSQGFGTARTPYSDALGPWLHGSLSYYLHDVPMSYLYRPTIGLFFSTIISATNSISAVPTTWSVLFFLSSGALFILGGWGHRAILAGVFGLMVIFFSELVRPLNPETLMADFWPMFMGLTGIWLIALSQGKDSHNLPGAAAGFLLLGIAACVRGPQLASGAALLVWLAPGWLKQRNWLAIGLLPVVFAGPFVVDSAIQKKYGIEGNGSVSLYGFYSDPNHQWTPEAHSRFLREKPDPVEVRARYLGLLFSAEGVNIVAEKSASVLNTVAGLTTNRLFLLGLTALAGLGWLLRSGSTAPVPSSARKWMGRAAFTCIALAAAALLFARANIPVVPVLILTIGLLVHAACTGRRLTALLTLAFCAGLAFHASLGLNGGQRVIGNYEILFLAALVAAVAETPFAPEPRQRLIHGVAGAVFAIALIGYTGNFWIRTGFKSELRTQLAVPQTAAKLSDHRDLDRSLYLTGQMGLFYTTFDSEPFGSVRSFASIVAPDGFGNVTLIVPARVAWLPPESSSQSP
jgi:hypothetical protein